MSEKQTAIRLKAPERIRREGFVSRGHVCGYCHGNGWFYGNRQKSETVPCPDCGGTGEVMAVVTVEWKPDKQ